MGVYSAYSYSLDKDDIPLGGATGPYCEVRESVRVGCNTATSVEIGG